MTSGRSFLLPCCSQLFLPDSVQSVCLYDLLVSQALAVGNGEDKLKLH